MLMLRLNGFPFTTELAKRVCPRLRDSASDWGASARNLGQTFMRSVTDLGVEHDLRRAVPPRGHVLRQRARVVELGVGDAGEAKVADSDGRRNKR